MNPNENEPNKDSLDAPSRTMEDITSSFGNTKELPEEDALRLIEEVRVVINRINSQKELTLASGNLKRLKDFHPLERVRDEADLLLKEVRAKLVALSDPEKTQPQPTPTKIEPSTSNPDIQPNVPTSKETEEKKKVGDAVLLEEIDEHLRSAVESFLAKDLIGLNKVSEFSKMRLRQLSGSINSEDVRKKAVETAKYIEEKIRELTTQQSVDIDVGQNKTSGNVDLELNTTTPNLNTADTPTVIRPSSENVAQVNAPINTGNLEKSKTLSDIEKVDSIMKIIDTSTPEDLVRIYSGLKSDLESFTGNERTSIVVESATRVLKHLEDVVNTARGTVGKKGEEKVKTSTDIDLSEDTTTKNTSPNTTTGVITPDTTAGVFVQPEANKQTVENVPSSTVLPYEEWLKQNPLKKMIPLNKQELDASGLIKSNRNKTENIPESTPEPNTPAQNVVKDESLINLFKERYSGGINNTNSPESVKTPGRMERLKNKILERKNKLFEEGTLLEQAKRITKSSLEVVRGAGEWYNKQDPKVKLAVSLSLTAVILGSSALSMGATTAVAGGVATGLRVVGSMGTFVVLEDALKNSQIKKVGAENYTESDKKRHAWEAAIFATLLGGGVVGDAINNITSGRLMDALGFSSTKPPVDVSAPSAIPKIEPTDATPPKPQVQPPAEPNVDKPNVPTNDEEFEYPATPRQETPDLNNTETTTSGSPVNTTPSTENTTGTEAPAPNTQPEPQAVSSEISPDDKSVNLSTPEPAIHTPLPEYSVKPNDNMYKVIRANFPEINSLDPGRQANAIENILAKIRENPGLYGIKDTNLGLNVGDKINIEGIREIIDTTEIGGKSILETAKELSPETMKNIENYSPPQTVTPSSPIPTPTNSGVILDNTIIDAPYENPSAPEQPKTDTQNISGETMITGVSAEDNIKVPYIPEAVASLPSGTPHPLETHFEPSAKDFTELSRADVSLIATAKGIFNTELNNIFGKTGFFSSVPGVDSDLWKSVKDVQLDQLYAEKSKDESIEKLKGVLERLSGDAQHHPTGKETVEEFMKRTTLLMAEKGTKVT